MFSQEVVNTQTILCILSCWNQIVLQTVGRGSSARGGCCYSLMTLPIPPGALLPSLSQLWLKAICQQALLLQLGMTHSDGQVVLLTTGREKTATTTKMTFTRTSSGHCAGSRGGHAISNSPAPWHLTPWRAVGGTASLKGVGRTHVSLVAIPSPLVTEKQTGNCETSRSESSASASPQP